MTPANSADYHAPASANQACAHFRPDGGTKTAEVTTPREMTAMLKYTACMRSHGEPDFPDPSAGGGFSLAGANIDVSAPQFQAAQQTCQKIAPW